MDPARWEEIKANIFPGESGGDYNALYGYANRPGGQFANVNLTGMTVNDAIRFSDPSGPYAQSVKGQIGRVATPMGAYQVVGSTLRAAVKGLGLTGNEPFNEATQDLVGQWIYKTQGPGAWAGWGKGKGNGNMGRASGGGASTSSQGQMPPEMSDKDLPWLQRPKVQDTFDRLAIGLQGMTLNPNEAMMRGLQSRVDGRAAKAEEKQVASRTAAWLRSKGREDLAQAVESGSLGGREAAALVFKETAPREGVVVEGRIVDPVTGRVIYGPEPGQDPRYDKDALSSLNTIRDDVRAELSTFEIVKSGYRNIATFYDNPGSTSDYALAVSFAKILDPGSVAREGEVAAVQNAGAKVPALGQALKNAITGEGALTPQVREDIARLATEIYNERAGSAQQVLQKYGSLADKAGLDREDVIGYDIPQARPVIPSVIPSAAKSTGLTQEDWDDMPMQERAAWME